MKRVVVLGGGFGGVEAAIRLSKVLDRKEYEVLLVSEKENLYLYPFSIWIPVGRRTPEDLEIPLSKVAKKHTFTYLIERVARIQTSENRVFLESKSITYDYLVVALGARRPASDRRRYFSLCSSPGEAVAARDAIFECIRKGAGVITVGYGLAESDPSMLRAGPACEIVLNIDDLLRQESVRQNFTIVFHIPSVDSLERFIGSRCAKKVFDLMKRKDIELRIDPKVVFDDGIVRFSDNSEYAADCSIMLPGMESNGLGIQTDIPMNEQGFIEIESTTQVRGSDNCFAVGDATYYGDCPSFYVKQGRIAEIMAKTASKNIQARIESREMRAKFTDGLKTLFMLDAGRTGFLISTDGNKQTVIFGKVAHYAKLALEFFFKHHFA